MQQKFVHQEKRARILQTATQCFADHGFAATTIAEVAKASGVSFGSVFTYFSTKDTLFRCAVLEPLEEMKRVFLDIDVQAPPSLTVQHLITKHLKFISEHGVYLRVAQHVIAQSALFPSLFNELDAFHLQFKNTLQPIITDGQCAGEFEATDPGLVATAYLSFLIGVRLAHPDAPGSPLWDDMRVLAFRLFGPIVQ